jgi:SAM-dependent methyltransferase
MHVQSTLVIAKTSYSRHNFSMRVSVREHPHIIGMRQVTIPTSEWHEYTTCPLCNESSGLCDAGSVEGTLLATVLSLCSHCSYGFLRRRPKESWYDTFYADEWDEHGRKYIADSTPHIHPISKVYDFCAQILPSGLRVLDIGAGFGGVILAFREHGFEVCAIEPSRHRQELIRDHLSMQCWGSFNDIPPSLSLDMVCMNHVLEHVQDPVAMVRVIHQRLPTGGFFYIAVPDFWQEYFPQSLHFVPHVSLFTLRSLELLLMRQGFRILKSHIGREIQILAVKSSEAAISSLCNSKDAGKSFCEQATSYFLNAFGSRKRAVLYWHISRGRRRTYYLRHFFPGWQWLPGAMLWVIKRRTLLPSTLSRLFPFGLGGWMPRWLSVDIDGERALPIVVHHQESGAPVWVK